MKKALLAIGIILLLLVVSALALPFLVDLNKYQGHYRPLIEDALNRKVSLKHIRLTVWPRIGASVAELTVMEDPTFGTGPFASLAALDVGVKILPLLRGKVEVDAITLHKPVVTVIKNRDGVQNLSTLGPTAQPAPPIRAPEAPPEESQSPLQVLALLAVERVAITEGRLTYRDESAPKAAEFVVEALELEADRVRLGQTLSLHVAGTVQPWNLPVVLDGTAGPLVETLDLERFDLDVSVGKTSGNLTGSVVGGRLSATLSSPEINTAELPVTLPLTKPVRIRGLRVTGTVSLPLREGVPIAEAVTVKDLQGVLESGSSSLRLKGSLVQHTINVTAASSSFRSEDVPLALPIEKPFQVKDLQVTAKARYPFKEGVPPLELADVLNLDTALVLGKSTVQLKGQVQGGKATVTANSAALNTADLPVEIPLSEPVLLTDLHVTAELKGNDARVTSLSTKMLGGLVKGLGQMKLGEDAPPFSGKVTLTGLQLGPVLKTVGTGKVWMSGAATGNLEMEGRGFTMPELTKSLKGKAQLAVKDGKLEGVNVLQEALALLKVAGLVRRDVQATVFSTMEAEMTISEGVVQVNKLVLESNDFQGTATGKVGFDQTLNLQAKLSLPEGLSRKITGSSPVANFVLGGKRLTVPLIITGTAASPSFALDAKIFAAQAQERVQEKVEEAVTETLEDLLTGKSRPEDLKKKGKDLLEGLFGR